MAKERVGNTALGAAVCRMIEQFHPEKTRLFDDPLVKDLVGAPLRMLLNFKSMRQLTIKETDAIMPGIYGLQICRTRFIDEAVLSALAQGIKQVVILGAGLDTRPYRLPGLEQVHVFEVDLPSVQATKKRALLKHFKRLPEHVTFLPINFTTQTLQSAFAGTAFDPAQPTVFLWEGVTQYLPAEAVHQTLAFVGQSAPGSILVFTYVLKSVIERCSGLAGANKLMSRMEKGGTPWLFGLKPAELPAFLQPFHFNLLTDFGNNDYHTHYLKPLGRELVVSEVERSVQAVLVK